MNKPVLEPNAHTHDRLVRELAVGAGAAVVFPEYDLSPEHRYPVAIEQNRTIAQWVVAAGRAKGLAPELIAVAGDSVGGNMSAALTLMVRERGGIALRRQVLFYPVTDAAVRHRLLPAPRRTWPAWATTAATI
ncbi:alpha/beta hydrolase fold domain-containing protein [Streptosporangium sp. CA-115845]|uniref:alpha/beta hydrolase fold domain-containing protein n=1 Tax=Streptosporangium sp. CA-115845 TaxID=3240071 RepID=UPI003D8CA61C